MKQPLWLLQLAGTEVRRRVEPWARNLMESDSVAQLQVELDLLLGLGLLGGLLLARLAL